MSEASLDYIGFQDSPGYRVRPYFKNTNKMVLLAANAQQAMKLREGAGYSQGCGGLRAGYNRFGGQGLYAPGTPKVLLFHVPGEGPAVPRQLDSALSLGTSERVSPWGSPYKAIGLGKLHAWVWGGHGARGTS